MNYYIWEINEDRKEIVFNKSESQMGDMEALSNSGFDDLVRQHPDYNLVDLEQSMIQIFNHVSTSKPIGKAGLVEMLMKNFKLK